MLYRLRTGDIVICEDKKQNRNNLYLLTYESGEGYGIRCMTCGELVGVYPNRDALKEDLLYFLHIVGIIPKELLADAVNQNRKLKYSIHIHDIADCEHELGIELEIP